MEEYRRRNDNDAWHWCKNCSNWPIEPGVYIIYRKPTSGELCNECRAKDSAGTCRK